ncbi:hypothetical protein [Micromonospora lupini]|uniref:hypothetical protein n=1 Tax=Micromonospora lupini TaxID=285679 RepID=UPI0033EA18A4
MTASERVSRRIPAQSIKGPDAASTESLKWLYYLIEVERQAEIFNIEFQAAIRTAQGSKTDEAWRHLQSAMFAGIVVSRLVTYIQDPKPEGWPGSTVADARRASKKAKKERIAKLRSLLELPEDKDFVVYKVGDIRNSLEHVDEWIDRALADDADGPHSLTDWYIAGSYFLRSPEEAGGKDLVAGLRGFAPESGFAVFHRDQFDLFALDLNMVNIRRKSREAQAVIVGQLKGRLSYGGSGQLAGFDEAMSQRVEAWAERRAAMEEALPDPASIDGVTRIWMQVGE